MTYKVSDGHVKAILGYLGIVTAFVLMIWVRPEPAWWVFVLLLGAAGVGWWLSGDRRFHAAALPERISFVCLLLGGAAFAAEGFPQRWLGIVLVAGVTAWAGFSSFKVECSSTAFLILSLGLTSAPMTELNLERDPWTILAAVLFAMFGLRELQKASLLEVPWSVPVLSLFVLWIFIGISYSVYPYATWRHAWMWAFNLMVFGLSAVLLQREHSRQALVDYLVLLVGSYALSSAVAGAVRIYYMGWTRGLRFRIFVFHRHPTYTIFLMILILPVLAAYIRKKRLNSIVITVSVVFSLLYLFIYSYSREGWLLLFLYGVYLMWIYRRRLKFRTVLPAAAGGLVIVGIFLWRFTSIWNRIESMLYVSESLRGKAWKIFWALHHDHPWLGYGVGTDRYIYPQALGHFHPLSVATRQFLYEAHNAYIEILVGAGWIGLIVFLLFLAGTTVVYIRKQEGIGLCMRAVAAAVWIDLFFNYRFHAQDTGLFLVVILALLAAYGVSAGGALSLRYVPGRRNALGAVVFGVGVCLIGILSSVPWIGRYYVREAQEAVSDAKWPKARIYFSRAATLEPLNAHPYYYLSRWALQMRNDWGCLANIRKAVELCPNYAFYRYYLTLAELRAGRVDEALKQITAAKTLEPYTSDGNIRLTSGIINWNSGKISEAKQDILYAVLADSSLIRHPFLKRNIELRNEVVGNLGVFVRFLVSNPSFGEIYCGFIGKALDVLDKVGLQDMSDMLWRQVLNRFPSNEELVVPAVKRLIARGMLDDSERILFRSLGFLPRSFNLHNLLGYVYLRKKEVAKAEVALEMAEKYWIHISMDNLFGYRLLAEIYGNTKENQALKRIEKKLAYLQGGRFKKEQHDLKIHFGSRGAELQLLSLIQ